MIGNDGAVNFQSLETTGGAPWPKVAARGIAANSCPGIIAFVGSDGSGKSTLARTAQEECAACGIPAQVVWSRFNNFLSKPLLALARVTGHSRREVHDGVTFGYHNFRGAVFLRHPFIALQTLDVNLAAAMKARLAGKQAGILIFERSAWDTLADVILDTGCDRLAVNAWGRWMTASVSGRGPVLWVSRSKASILATRPELKHDRLLDEKIALYGRLAAVHGWHRIDNSRSLDEAKADVREQVRRLVA